jgi:fructose-specific phosphotransferase system IIA component
MSVKKAKPIRLSELLKEKFIKLDLKGDSKLDIITELVELIASSRRLKNRKAFFKAVVERESMGSTAIGNGVAIPHAKTKGLNNFILAFAKKNEGIDFEALDTEKTFLFFVLASPENEVGNHLKILAEISRLVKDKFIIEGLKKANDKKEIRKLFLNFERNLSY